jgi:uncharacterized protein YjgD (DUF1641 family)
MLFQFCKRITDFGFAVYVDENISEFITAEFVMNCARNKSAQLKVLISFIVKMATCITDERGRICVRTGAVDNQSAITEHFGFHAERYAG